MESVLHYFKFLAFMTQLIIHINIWLSCVMKYNIGGGEIKSWNYRGGRIS